MLDLFPYLFSYPSYYSVAHRYNLLSQVKNLQELEQKISPILHPTDIQKLKKQAEILKVESEKRNVKILTYFDSTYPEILKQINKPPIVLFYKGNIDLLSYDLVSVVGTRNPSPIATVATTLIPQFLNKSRQLGIVSGVAVGIDRTVMLTSLESNIPTIGILGTGMEKEYPYSNRDLYQKINNSPYGLLITEMRIDEVIGKWSFPKRNRIISGICELLVVMEAPIKSGAMSSVAHALEQGREVMVFDDTALLNNEGGRKLLDDGATKLTLQDLKESPDSFFHISEIVPKKYEEMGSLFSSLSQLENQGLFQYIGGGYYKKKRSAGSV